MGRFRLGTSSWSAKGWVGPFYPKGLQAGEFLTHYATVFDTVEADVTYYRVPSRDMVRGWVRKTPEGFRLAAKFPRSIVHAGEGPRPDPVGILDSPPARRDTEAFLAAMELLGERCGPLLLQFPYFHKASFREPGPFLERLDAYLEALPPDFRYAVEVRNRGFLGPALADLLRARGVCLALAEIPYMPHPDALAERFELATADFGYVRLIGDRKATEAHTKTFDALVLDKGQELRRWADWLGPAAAAATETFVYANNHYAGHGPATIRELAALLGSSDA